MNRYLSASESDRYKENGQICGIHVFVRFDFKDNMNPAMGDSFNQRKGSVRKMKRFEAVIFDMDGVIFDSEQLVIKCWKVVADKYGIRDIEDTCRKCLGLNKDATRELMLGVYGADFPYDEYKAEMSALFHEQAAGGRLPMKPGVVELLQALRKNGRKLALASSTRKAVVEQELREAGILSYFDRVVCGDMVSRSKPEPDIYLEACRQLHVLPEQAYAIEDSYNGIRSAYVAGLHPIMVPDLAPVTEEMQELSDVILDSLTEVEKYLFL